jgi:diacylglycerol O-acyltransferase / wax synthase
VSPGRRFATAPLALSDVKQTSKQLGVAVNDIVVATAAATNTSPERLVGNEFTYLTPSLPVHIDDPMEPVKLTALATKIAKENHQLLGPTVLPAWVSYLPTALAPQLFRTQARRVESASVMNLTISNVPGHAPGATSRARRSERSIPSGHWWRAAAMVDAFIEIRRAAGLSGRLTPLDATLPRAGAARLTTTSQYCLTVAVNYIYFSNIRI